MANSAPACYARRTVCWTSTKRAALPFPTKRGISKNEGRQHYPRRADPPIRRRRRVRHIGCCRRALVDKTATPPPPPPTVDVPAVGKQVIGLLRTQWSSDPFSQYGISFDDDGMTLINTGLNKYDGLETVHTRKGTPKFLSVTVWADPTGAMFYQMDGSRHPI